VPSGVTLTPYKGPCVIKTDHTVIDGKVVSCELIVAARHVVIRNSALAIVVLDQDDMHADHQKGWSLRIVDSEVDAGRSDGPGVCCGNYTLLRVEMRGGHNGAQCENGARYCTLVDSWIHGQYEPAGGRRHLGGFLNDGGTPTFLLHNSITCDAPAENDDGGCTGDVNLIPNFGAMRRVLVQHNYLGANANSAFCTYAGSLGPAPYAGRANRIVDIDRVVGRDHTVAHPAPGQAGSTHRCASYGPVIGYRADRPGNVWSGNQYDDGTPIRCRRPRQCA
jgi:hypothetical protein